MENNNEPYDYKFVKWMTKNKVMFIGLCDIVLYFVVNLWKKPVHMLWTMLTVVLLRDIPLVIIWKILKTFFFLETVLNI